MIFSSITLYIPHGASRRILFCEPKVVMQIIRNGEVSQTSLAAKVLENVQCCLWKSNSPQEKVKISRRLRGPPLVRWRCQGGVGYFPECPEKDLGKWGNGNNYNLKVLMAEVKIDWKSSVTSRLEVRQCRIWKSSWMRWRLEKRKVLWNFKTRSEAKENLKVLWNFKTGSEAKKNLKVLMDERWRLEKEGSSATS